MPLRPVIVYTNRCATAGLLYFKSRNHVVLLNNLAAAADLGRLKRRRDVHIEPEADVTIIPRSRVVSIEYPVGR